MSQQRKLDVNILLVDDREEDLLTLRTLLDDPQCNLVTARSGAEALRRVLERDYAVILIDVLMPTMDGFEVASVIKQRDRSRHIPIIFLTGAGTEMTFIYRAYSIGAVDYLAKPLDERVLKAKVAIFTELYRKDKHIQQQAEALIEADRRERERQLAEFKQRSDKRYRDLAEAIPHIVWTADALGDVGYVNRRWTEFTGTGGEQALGWGWLTAVHPDDAVRCEQQWREAIAGGKVHEIECRLRRQDGAYLWHLGRAVPERDADDRIVGWLGTYTDFDDAKRAIHARDEFLSIASHELRTPLTTLRLQLDGLRRRLDREAPQAPRSTDREAPQAPRSIDREAPQAPGGTEKDPQQDGGGAVGRSIEKALGQTRRLEKLLDSLLDVSRLTAGRLKLEVEQTDLAQSTREIAGRLMDAAGRAGCVLRVNADQSAVGTWDPLRVEQIVTNLLSNAIKYGAGKPVEIRVERTEALARLVVRDQGIGIAAEDLPRLFHRFERIAPVRNYGGLGMGLYIVRQIAEAHGGTVQAVSELGQGSTFTVELPWLPPAPSAESRDPAASRAGSRTDA